MTFGHLHVAIQDHDSGKNFLKPKKFELNRFASLQMVLDWYGYVSKFR